MYAIVKKWFETQRRLTYIVGFSVFAQLVVTDDVWAEGLWVGLSDVSKFNVDLFATWDTTQQMKVFAGDFDGDGKTDVMKFDVPSTSATGNLGLWVGLSKIDANGNPFFKTSRWSIWSTNKRMKILVGDFNNDGKTDVMKFDVPASLGPGGRLGLWVGLSDGTKFNTRRWATWSTTQQMKNLAGDFNGDGKTDVMKFDVPAPLRVREQCETQGGKWISQLNHCSKIWKQIASTLDRIRNPLIFAYDGYFAIVDGGAKMRVLPEYVIKKLKPYYGEAMLRRVRYGASNHTSSDDTTMTDCYKIYFPAGRGHVAALKNGEVFKNNSRVHLLLHELTHVKQCDRMGSRGRYAEMWFAELTYTTFSKLLTNPRKISNKLIHDSMPMEDQADANADRILNLL